MQVNEWLEAVKSASNTPRIERLKLIASGPDYRDDVQAAKRLLEKPRYKAIDTNTPALMWVR